MRLIIATVLFGLLYATPALSEQADHWNYVGLSVLRVDIDNSSEDADGFAIDSIVTLMDSFYLSGKYQQYKISDTEVDRLLFGFGGKFKVNKNLSPFAQLDYVYVDANDRISTLSASVKYWLIGIGLSGNYTKVGYKIGLSHYEAISDELENENGYFGEIFYSFNKKLSAGLEFESVDNSNVYELALRYHF